MVFLDPVDGQVGLQPLGFRQGADGKIGLARQPRGRGQRAPGRPEMGPQLHCPVLEGRGIREAHGHEMAQAGGG